jgi:hypothetical protein
MGRSAKSGLFKGIHRTVHLQWKDGRVVRKAFDVDMTGDYNKVKARNPTFDSVWEYGPSALSGAQQVQSRK